MVNESGGHVEAPFHASGQVLRQLTCAILQRRPVEAKRDRLIKLLAPQTVIAPERSQVFRGAENEDRGPIPEAPNPKPRGHRSNRLRSQTLPRFRRPGSHGPQSLRMSVLLPAPFGPSRPRHSPRFSSIEMPSTAITLPNRFTSESILSGCSVEAAGVDWTFMESPCACQAIADGGLKSTLFYRVQLVNMILCFVLPMEKVCACHLNSVGHAPAAIEPTCQPPGPEHPPNLRAILA